MVSKRLKLVTVTGDAAHPTLL